MHSDFLGTIDSRLPPPIQLIYPPTRVVFLGPGHPPTLIYPPTIIHKLRLCSFASVISASSLRCAGAAPLPSAPALVQRLENF